MEVVQDFVNSPSLEKFENIPCSQRRSLLAEYFKVCKYGRNMVFGIFILDNWFVC